MDKFKPPEDANAMSSDCMTSDGAASDSGAASSNGRGIDMLSAQDSLLSTPDPVTDITSVPTPNRVLVFTTVKLLGLLALCRRGAVDGTFSVKL